jgi:type IV fimbrial biogenesis protein FimT
MKTKSLGFTLIELMFVVLVAAILLALAAPSFDDLLRRNTVQSQQLKLLSAISSARQEAVNRAITVSICRSTDGANCTAATGAWTGWIIFTDTATAGTKGGSDTILAIQSTVEPGVTISLANQGGTASRFIQFSPNGAVAAGISGGGIFKLCDRQNSATTVRGVIVTSSGRPAESLAGASGVHMNTLTSPAAQLTCP